MEQQKTGVKNEKEQLIVFDAKSAQDLSTTSNFLHQMVYRAIKRAAKENCRWVSFDAASWNEVALEHLTTELKNDGYRVNVSTRVYLDTRLESENKTVVLEVLWG